MDAIFGPVIVGVVLIILGCSQMKGNISTLHRYHRRNVSEENRIPFGRLTGMGSIIIGIAMILNGGLTCAAGSLQLPLLATVGMAVLILGLIAGLVIIFHAIFKYNKGIF